MSVPDEGYSRNESFALNSNIYVFYYARYIIKENFDEQHESH